jgi:hypothetical protein
VNSHSIPLPSGKIFDYLNPQPEMIDINDIALSTSKICRFNGYCDGFYPVSQHCYIGSLHIEPEFALEFLLHDGTEAFVNDLVSPFKRLLRDYITVEDRIATTIRRRFGLPLKESTQVKEMDHCMYWTERYSLCKWYDNVWKTVDEEHLGGKALDGVVITPIDWNTSRLLFLERYAQLTIA